MPMAWVGFVAFAIVGGLTEFVRRLAVKLALTDRPGARKGHQHPTPYLGGVVIVVGVLSPAAAAVGGGDARILTVLVAAAVIALLGLADDLRPLSPSLRLLVEGLAASSVVASGGHVKIFGNWLDYIVPMLWIVVITNSFNLLDNMDGAAAGVGCVTAAALALPALMVGQRGAVALLLALACGCAGFLPHNWTPARIFMGDAGSLFIGFVIAASALLVFASPAHHASVAGPLMVTFVATVDTCVVMVSRHRAGRPLMLGGTDHVSHRLRRLGLSTWQVALALSGTAALTCLAVIPVVRGWVPAPVPLIIGAGLGVALVWLLQKVPVYDHLGAKHNVRAT
ncbi:MraY family glycosyltransferase [Actinoallomurus bryophytorum]|uniref:UDP-GlcNAc:undecaprenyl-phosphate GlcNAc-1-phosphate transferase n=1 Tax=Actinoallomurus bryophytorum TaxID=1490222 RepID=A0A543CPY3_9ACTN|nr:UDP-GlcNAc:undecaprenyl-phosphate GlcNAc-1-phosphate transferase [Actinoallomurus bryophytorum]